MTRLLITDPGAAHPAKNAAAPGLPKQPTNRSERNFMVGTSIQRALYADVLDLLHHRPVSIAPCADRAGWLFDLADALDAIGEVSLAQVAWDAGLDVVRETVETVAGGEH